MEIASVAHAVLPGPTRSEILGNFVAQQAEAQGITQDEAEQAIVPHTVEATSPTTTKVFETSIRSSHGWRATV